MRTARPYNDPGKVVLLVAALVLLVTSFSTALAQTAKPGDGSRDPDWKSDSDKNEEPVSSFVPGEIVVKTTTSDAATIDSINMVYGTNVRSYFSELDIFILETAPDADIVTLARQISQDPIVIFAHPNFTLDPLQSVQGSIPFSDANFSGNYWDQPAATRLDLNSAHTVSTGTGVKVGVIDGGINYSHPALDGKAISGWDYVGNDAEAFDEAGGNNSGHGTFVAGIIHLVAPDATIVGYRVSDTSGQSDGDRVAQAILQAVGDGCQIINLSLVMVQEHEVLRQAIEYARENDVMVVVAAGNGQESTPTYPAIDPNVLAVTAVDSTDRLADFSRYGSHIDMSAPGANVYSPYLDTIYAWWSGTSFAAPFVSGQAALVQSKAGGTLGWSRLHAALTRTADPIDGINPAYDGLIGVGLPNPPAALQDAAEPDTAWVVPTQISFITQQGSYEKLPGCVGVFASNPEATYTVSAIHDAGFLKMPEGVFTVGDSVCFEVTGAGLLAGQYHDTLLFDFNGVSNGPLKVAVTLLVDAGQTDYVTIDKSQYSLTMQADHLYYTNVCTELRSSNQPAAYTATVSDSNSFLTIVNPAGFTDTIVCANIDPFGLSEGTHCNTIYYVVDGIDTVVAQQVCLTIEGTPAVGPYLNPDTVVRNIGWTMPDTIVGTSYLGLAGDTVPYTATGGKLLTPTLASGLTNSYVNCFIPTNYAYTDTVFWDSLVYTVDGYAEPLVLWVKLQIHRGTYVAPPTLFLQSRRGSTTPQESCAYVYLPEQPAAPYTSQLIDTDFTTVLQPTGMSNDSVCVSVDPSGLGVGYHYDSVSFLVEGSLEPGVLEIEFLITDSAAGEDSIRANPDYFIFNGNLSGSPILSGCTELRASRSTPYSAHIVGGGLFTRLIDSTGYLQWGIDTACFVVEPGSLPAGTYYDTIAYVASFGLDTAYVGIRLDMVGDSTGDTSHVAMVTPSAFQYNIPEGGESMYRGCAFIRSTNAPAVFTVDHLSPSGFMTLLDSSGTTDDTVCFNVAAGSLTAGTYCDTLVFTVAGVPNPVISTVCLTVTADTSNTPTDDSIRVTPNPVDVLFGGTPSGPVTTTVFVQSSNAPAAYFAYVTGNAGSMVTPLDSVGVTNDSLRLEIDAAGLSPGTYYDSLIVEVDGITSAEVVPIIVTIQDGGSVVVGLQPDTLFLRVPWGSTDTIRACSFLNTPDGAVNYTATGGHLTTPEQASGTTNDSVCVLVETAKAYGATLYIDSALYYVDGLFAPLKLIIWLEIDKPAMVSPSPLEFYAGYGSSDLQQGCAVLWMPQQPFNNAYTAELVNSQFTTLLTTSGVTPDTICVSVDPTGLEPGLYYDTVKFTVENTLVPTYLSIELAVVDSSATGTDSVWVTPPTFSFSVQQGDTVSQPFCGLIQSTNAPAAWTASFADSSEFTWLLTSSGYTPDSLCFVTNAGLLDPGTYCDTIEVRVAGVAAPVLAVVCVTVEGQGSATLVSTLTNYPNPFNPTTTIAFELAKTSPVRLTVYNVLGRRVKELVNTDLPAGLHEVVWDGTDGSGSQVASGIYFYRLEAASVNETRKMLLLK